MKLKNVFKKTIAIIEVAAMTLALMASFSIANTAEVLAAGTLTLNEGTKIVSDSEEVLTFIAPEDGTYYFYSITTGDYDIYADLITETYSDSNDDSRGLDFRIEAELSEGEECELRVSSYDDEYETMIYVCDEATAQELVYRLTDSDDKYVTVGESCELTVELLNLAGDTIDSITEGYSIKWFEEDDNGMKLDLDITGTTYTIDEITNQNLYSEATDYKYYVARLYDGEEEIDYTSFYIYDAYTTYFDGYIEVVSKIGESVTLEAEIYDCNDNCITDFDDSFTFEWYKVTEEDFYEDVYGDVLGTETTYKIESVQESDMCCEDTGYIRYVCRVYRDGIYVATYEAQLTDAALYWNLIQPEPIYASVGDTVTFKPVIVDADGNEMDINDERFTYEWYGPDYEEIVTDSTYTIDSVTEDVFCNEALHESYDLFIYDSLSDRINMVSFILYKKDSGDEPTTEPPTTEPPTTAAPTTVAPTTVVTKPTAVAPTTVATKKVKKPAKAKINKVTPKKKTAQKIKLTLKKIKSAAGYQVAVYNTKKNAKKNKKAIVKKFTKKVKVTLKSKKLKNKKKLFVKARAYKLDGKKKVYGKWSNLKSVKIKK